MDLGEVEILEVLAFIALLDKLLSSVSLTTPTELIKVKGSIFVIVKDKEDVVYNPFQKQLCPKVTDAILDII